MVLDGSARNRADATPTAPGWGADAACYPILNRGPNRATVFADDADRAYFLGLRARYQQRFALRLYHYCLMGNHFHLAVQLADAPPALVPDFRFSTCGIWP